MRRATNRGVLGADRGGGAGGGVGGAGAGAGAGRADGRREHDDDLVLLQGQVGLPGRVHDLFQRNHYPLLKAGVADGRFVSVKTYVPRYHGDGRADWTFAVEIVAKDDAPSGPSEDETIKKLFPDQATYKKEEQRRFEILEAHWDVPLNGVDLDARK